MEPEKKPLAKMIVENAPDEILGHDLLLSEQTQLYSIIEEKVRDEMSEQGDAIYSSPSINQTIKDAVTAFISKDLFPKNLTKQKAADKYAKNLFREWERYIKLAPTIKQLGRFRDDLKSGRA